MKKIMFNDKYGLTQAVLDGRKTMTRRVITNEDALILAIGGDIEGALTYSRYQLGEVVAIAQRYKDAKVTCLNYLRATDNKGDSYADGFFNKMFVKSDLMPHHIRITNIRVERLQDISDEDCLREGVRLRSEPSKYQEVWSPEYTFGNGKYHAKYPRAAFAALIDCISGKGTWERNPYVFVYEFELVD